MADSKSKPSIPQWQQQNSSSSPNSEDQATSSRATLLEQASKFLEDESIRDASTDRKIAFLESKGLEGPEIESLLGVSRNPEASSSTEEQSKTADPAPESSSPTSSTERQVSSSTPSPNPPAKRDVPPIITYPEFLLHQSKPPPLVTLQSVLYTLYGAAGLGASMYAASEYLVKPMLASLTNARHDLADTTHANLLKINEKLEQNVSRIPPHLTTTTSLDNTQGEQADAEEDLESITSDPTELFHRDVATQTSPSDLSTHDPQQLWSTTTPDPNDDTAPDPTATVTTHQKRLESIGSHLREFADAQNQSGTLEDTTRSRINDLQHYLDGLLYSKNTYAATSGYGMYSSSGLDSGTGTASGVAKAEEEAIASFRAEIRGVKGALLSARNFPSGRGARIGGGSFSR